MSMMIAVLLAGQISIPRPSVSIPRPSISVPSVSIPSVSVPSVSLPSSATTTTPVTTPATQLTQSQRRDQLIMDSQSLLSRARTQLAAMPTVAPITITLPGAVPAPTRADLDAQITTSAAAYDTMARFSRSDTVGMESAMDRSSKANEALANIMKKISDTPAPITANSK